MVDVPLREQIDACRAHWPDEQLPELAVLAQHLADDPQARALLAQSRRLDERLAATLAEVPVPLGLAERITAQLAVAQWVDGALPAGESVAETAAPGDVIAAPSPAAARPAAPRSRRHRLVLWAVAASLLVAATIYWLRPEVLYDRDLMAEEARLVADQLLADAGLPWDASIDVGHLTPSDQLLLLPGTRYLRVENFLGRSGICYQVRGMRGAQASLLVVRLHGLPTAPRLDDDHLALHPQIFNAGTGGLTTALWKERGNLYVLMVRGDGEAFRQFVPGRPAVAAVRRKLLQAA